jgi:hypothetical protein
MRLRGIAAAALVPVLLSATASCTRTVVVVVTPSPSPTGAAIVSPPPGTLFAHWRGVRFAYPDTWRLVSSTPTGDTTLNLVVSPDQNSFIRLQRFSLLLNVSADRLPEVKDQISKLLRTTAADVNGTVTSPLRVEGTAGLPGFVGSLRVRSSSGAAAQELLYVFFDETNEYTLACASTTATRDVVTAGCELARQTFAAPHPLP